MKKRSNWGFSRGVVYRHDRVYILSTLAHLEEQREHVTRVLRWNGQWVHWLIEWAIGGICVVDTPELQVFSMGLGGRIHVQTATAWHEEMVDTTDEGPPYRGMLRDIRLVGDSIYVAGMGRQVYQRHANGDWTRADAGPLARKGEARGVGFNSIDGFSADEIYAVGWGGEIWQMKKGKWKGLSSPTNVILERVLCAPDGNVYICGQAGTVIVGRDTSWNVVEHLETKDNFWGMEWFGGKIWLASLSDLYTLSGTTVERVDFGNGTKLTCGWLTARDGVIWSIGPEDVTYYDGTSWHETLPP
jgi:hypothetical protein